MDVHELCKETPEFGIILEYVKTLTFKSDPDYQKIKSLFKQLATNQKITIDNLFEWTDQMQKQDSK